MLRNALALCSGVALAAAGATQSPTYTDQGVGSVDKFGYSIRSAGDVDADGRTDFIYSAPFLDANGLVNAGLVRVRSGADGSLLYEFPGDQPGDEWGYQVEGVGEGERGGESLLCGEGSREGQGQEQPPSLGHWKHVRLGAQRRSRVDVGREGVAARYVGP